MGKQTFKESQVFHWDSEPADERRSEFMQSTGYATLSGYHSSDSRHLARQRSGRFGLTRLFVFALVFIALGGWAIVNIVPMLRH